MSFFFRMGRPVGNTQTIGEYLFDKMAHVAFITLMLFVGAESISSTGEWRTDLVLYAYIAMFTYTIFGKALWSIHHPTDVFDWRDLVFDLWCALFIPMVCTLLLASWVYGLVLIVWLLGVIAGSNNHWGSPS